MQQQKQLFNHPGIKIKDRIASPAKSYVFPIKRGKENKEVEFGMKVHMCQVGGIILVEHAGFKNFNECKRLKLSVLKNSKRFGKYRIFQLTRLTLQMRTMAITSQFKASKLYFTYNRIASPSKN